jgi:chromosomal replication initiator protein
MSAEPIGIYAEQVAKREAVVARLSPAARHQAFPKLYARPTPTVDPMIAAKAAVAKEMAALQAQNARQAKTIAKLRETVAAMQSELTLQASAAAIRTAHQAHDPKLVIAAFLRVYNAGRDDGERHLEVADLQSKSRYRDDAAPRHVCVWLVRQLSTHLSLPAIGKRFGGRDHTTCMHACRRAPHWMLVNPALKAAADQVLREFGALEGDT